MPIRTGEAAPYAPPATILHVVNALRDRGLTTPISSDVLLRAGISESLVPRVLRSLIVLEFLEEDGRLTPAMEALRRVPSADFKVRLAEHVRAVYEEVFQFTDPATDDIKRISDAFRAYEPMGQRARMVTLFLGLCEAAGIIPEGTLRKPTPTQSGAPPRKNNVIPKRPAERGKAASNSPTAASGMSASLPPALTGLLASLPANGAGWTKADRDQWVDLFGRVLDYVIQVRPAAAVVDADDIPDEDE